MKAVFGLLGIIVLLGIVYGLAFFGIIPVQQMADKTPALAPMLISLHLAKPKKRVSPAAAAKAPDPAQQAMDAQKKQLAADRAQLDKDRLAFEAQKNQAAAAPATGAAADPNAPDSAAKLNSIYDTMSPDDIVCIFAKLPDPDVIHALMQMDEKKAGKVLAALPVDRAALLTRRLAHRDVTNPSPAAPLPQTNL